MTNCPPRLRGDLSKWLCEINTGVYVGNVSARVRDALWDRVCQNLKNGQATLVFTAPGEQKMDFRTHNTAWQAVDFDGIKLMRRPSQDSEKTLELKPGFSKAAQHQKAQKYAALSPKSGENYTVIDLETTGLKPTSDEIIEYGALRIRNGKQVDSLSILVHRQEPLAPAITELTGITEQDLLTGTEPQQALQTFIGFIGKDRLVGHNISFDIEFLREASKRMQLPPPTNRCTDLMNLARRRMLRTANYKLITLAQHFQLADKVEHRALADCKLIDQVYCKLNESAV